METAKELTVIHHDVEKFFNKESSLPGEAGRSQLLLHQQKNDDNSDNGGATTILSMAYMTTTLPMKETTTIGRRRQPWIKIFQVE